MLKPFMRGRVPPIEPPEPSTPPGCVVGQAHRELFDVASEAADREFVHDAAAVRAAQIRGGGLHDIGAGRHLHGRANFAELELDFRFGDLVRFHLNVAANNFLKAGLFDGRGVGASQQVGELVGAARRAAHHCGTLVASLVTVTLASSTTAPLASVTSTRSVPSSLWAWMGTAAAGTSTAAQMPNKILLRSLAQSLLCLGSPD